MIDQTLIQPDPTIFDLSDWPVVRARFPELNETDRVTRLSSGIDSLLARREPFAVVWFMASHDHDDEPKEDDRAAHIWLKKVRKDLNIFVKGYAYVTADEAIDVVLRERLEKVASKLFVFPTYVTDDAKEAVEVAQNWMSKALTELE